LSEQTRADDVISVEAAVTLDGLFRERVKRTPDFVAYRSFDETVAAWRDYSWSQMEAAVARWQAALEREGLSPGDRVAVMMRNSPEWAMYDLAALGLSLVVVPLYTQDRAENVAYILEHAGCKVLLLEDDAQWEALASVQTGFPQLLRILILQGRSPASQDDRVQRVSEWLAPPGGEARHLAREGHALATIVYTSGTTGRPKGVMLSHHNILSNAHACLTGVMSVGSEDLFLSFLPLSHTFERTCGYYLAMMAGATTAYARSIPQLADDLQAIRPTILVSVPRIYERVWGRIRAALDEGPPARKRLFMRAVEVGYARFEHEQGRAPWRASFLLWPLLRRLVASRVLARLGGRMRAALSGGAALPPEISRVFVGLGLPVLQGYGMTETAPVVCANRPEDNVPASVGRPIPGVEVRLGEQDALLVRGPNVMLGYWKDPEATRRIMLPDGWLNSGDIARIDEGGHVYITGRLKEIIVMSTGEKVPPGDVESAIVRDPLFEQVMVLGEGRPYLSVIAVLNTEEWRKVAEAHGYDQAALGAEAVEKMALGRIERQLAALPGYTQVRRAALTLESWSIENGFLTPTMKLRRARVMERFNAEIDAMYAGH
jgi:long-chain acyl-CoA synthetase